MQNDNYVQPETASGVFHKKNINTYQKEKYEDFEKNHSDALLRKYESVLDLKRNSSKKIKILDIGGASGHFAMGLHKYFNDCEHDIYVVDITKYATWNQYEGEIHFIEGSSFELEKLFEPNSFDIIFVNYVFHHLVQESWKKTVDGIRYMLKSINNLLDNDGNLCVSECYYGRPGMDDLFSFIIFNLSTIKLALVAKMVRKIGSKSAGVGVCFLSKRKWQKLFTESRYKIDGLIDGGEKTIKKLAIKEQFFYFILSKNRM